jgi:hypothetical protein
MLVLEYGITGSLRRYIHVQLIYGGKVLKDDKASLQSLLRLVSFKLSRLFRRFW